MLEPPNTSLGARLPHRSSTYSQTQLPLLRSPFHLILPFSLLLACTLAGCTNHDSLNDDARTPQQREVERVCDSIRDLAPSSPRAALGAYHAVQSRQYAAGDSLIERTLAKTAAAVYVFMDMEDSARIAFARSRALIGPDGDVRDRIDLLVYEGVLLHGRFKIDSALAVLDRALELARPLNDTLRIAMIEANTGMVVSSKGNFRRATRLYLRAVQVYESLGKKRNAATIYGNLGLVYSRLGDVPRAIEYLEKAAAINTQIGSRGDLARDKANLGVEYKNLGQFDKAEAAYRASLTVAREIDEVMLTAQNLYNLGNMLMTIGRVRESREILTQCIDLCEEKGISYGTMLASIAMGELAIKEGRADEGITALERSLVAMRASGMLYETMSLHDILSAAYAADGRYREAYTHNRSYTAMRDSIFGSSSTEAVQLLEAEHKLERAELENTRLVAARELAELQVRQQHTTVISTIIIAVLLTVLLVVLVIAWRAKTRTLRLVEEQKQIIERTSEQLVESNNLKAMLLDVITHDLVGPLSTIRGSAELLAEQPDNAALVDIIRRASAHVDDVAANATALSRVAVDEDVPTKPLSVALLVDTVFDEYADFLHRAGIETENRLDRTLVVHANPVLVEVFRNFTSNAIRYAAEGRLLVVDALLAADAVTIRFADRGVTIPPDKRQAVFDRRYQLDPNRRLGSGLGLAIVHRILHAHGGTAWVEPNTPTGNIFCIRLPHDPADA